MLFIFGLLAFGFFLLMLQSFLVVIGWYKQPILRTFEVYGEEKIYSPMLNAIKWTLAFLMMLWFISAAVFEKNAFIFLGVFFALGMYYVYAWFKSMATQYPDIFMRFPHWYYDLWEETTREDRRRIAYMWMYLPRRTRLTLSTQDSLFRHWADLVILAV